MSAGISKCNQQWKSNPTLYKICGKKRCKGFDLDSDGSFVGGKPASGLENSCDDYDLKPCPTGYKPDPSNEIDISRKYGSYGNGWGCSWGTKYDEEMLRRCKKLPDDPYYNIAREKVFDTNNTRVKNNVKKEDLQFAIACCSGSYAENSSQAKTCGDLYTPKEGGEICGTGNDCEILNRYYCLGDIDSATGNDLPAIKTKLEEPVCQQYCSDGGCAMKLGNFCKKVYELNNNAVDPNFSEICGCNYPLEVYSNASRELAETYDLPDAFLQAAVSGNRACIYPECSRSSYKRPDDITREGNICPSVNLVNCITNANFNILESKVDEINLKQNADCSGKFKKKGEETPGSPEGADPDPGSIGTECSSVSDCDTGLFCCVNPSGTTQMKTCRSSCEDPGSPGSSGGCSEYDKCAFYQSTNEESCDAISDCDAKTCCVMNTPLIAGIIIGVILLIALIVFGMKGSKGSKDAGTEMLTAAGYLR